MPRLLSVKGSARRLSNDSNGSYGYGYGGYEPGAGFAEATSGYSTMSWGGYGGYSGCGATAQGQARRHRRQEEELRLELGKMKARIQATKDKLLCRQNAPTAHCEEHLKLQLETLQQLDEQRSTAEEEVELLTLGLHQQEEENQTLLETNTRLLEEVAKRFGGTLDDWADHSYEAQEVWGIAMPVVNKALDGYNVTIFTYGMTGSGKTYTMLGPALMDSAFEGQECLEYLMAGFGNVALRSTHYNEQSSRAHCILTLTLRQQLPDQRIRESKLRLVDLAGNERWVIHGPQISPQHARELATINKSLHILGSCLQIHGKIIGEENMMGAYTHAYPGMTTNRRGQELVKHVPYRDSTLTQLLRDSLAGNSYTLMICTICCSILYQMQTLSTLRFADRVKRVKMRATICDTVDPAEQQQQIQAEVEYLRSAVSGAASGNVQDGADRLARGFRERGRLASGLGCCGELKQKVSELRKACLGLEGENRVLREQIAELEKQPVPMKSTMKKAAARVRRANSEPSLPTPDPWFDHEDLGDLQAIYYRSHDDLGSRMAGSCPKGHRLDSLGSIAHPLPAAANAAYFEWHCDRPGCRGSSRQLDLGRFHCSLCQHDLCQVCYDQLVGKSYSKVDVHAHRARRKPPANSPPSPVARARVEGVERRPEPERRQPRPAFRAAPAPARSAPAPPPGKSAPSRTPRGPEEPKGPEKPP
eukprot:g6882.t1